MTACCEREGGTNLVEAAMEELPDFRSFKSDRLEVAFVVIVEEGQGLLRIWGARRGAKCKRGV